MHSGSLETVAFPRLCFTSWFQRRPRSRTRFYPRTSF